MKQSSGLSRRDFIRITASAGALLAGGFGYGMASRAETVRVEEVKYLLGSIAHLTIITSEPQRARQAIQAAFQRMSDLEDIFSRFRPQSQLSQLNATGVFHHADPTLYDVLTKAIAYGEATGGAFDVTIEPVLQLYRAASQMGHLPDAEDLAAVQERVDYRQITITNDTIRLNKPGMAVTLDGIAKGYIIDAGTAILSDYGFDHIMVELGGDLQTRSNTGSRPWQVSIQQPRETPDVPLVAQLDNNAMATSGDYQYTFTPDRRLHHIIDPGSGVSPDDIASATVIAPMACDADALSTAMMVMGAHTGLELVAQLPDVEALMITKQGATYHSAHFPLHI